MTNLTPEVSPEVKLNLQFRDELLDLKVGENNVELRRYNPTEAELLAIEEKLIEEMRLALSYNDLRLDLNSTIWVFVEDAIANAETTHEFTQLGHEWELRHGRVRTLCQWLNPKRNEPGQDRYALNVREMPGAWGKKEKVCDACGCIETTVPMTLEEAWEWAKGIDENTLKDMRLPSPVAPH